MNQIDQPQTNRIARLATRLGLKSIVFARSRLMVEVLTKYLKDVFDKDPRKPANTKGKSPPRQGWPGRRLSDWRGRDTGRRRRPRTR